MSFKAFALPVGLLMLGACTMETIEPVPALPSAEEQMFNSAVAMAAPNQNVQTARRRESDNCFWYQHVGPVETTELPLLTPNGNHVCGPTELAAPAEPQA